MKPECNKNIPDKGIPEKATWGNGWRQDRALKDYKCGS